MPRAGLGRMEFFYSDKFIFFTFNLPDFHTLKQNISFHLCVGTNNVIYLTSLKFFCRQMYMTN